jgi:hypothetical protein
MSEARKKPGMAFWVTVVVAVLVGYPLTFGPACWLVAHDFLPLRATWLVFRPVTLFATHGPYPVKYTLFWWARCFEPSDPETNPNNESPSLIYFEEIGEARHLHSG